MDRQQEQGMSEKIERVAHAIQDAFDKFADPSPAQMAIAAIEALRYPTDADFNGKFGRSSRELFTEMLDELLK